MGRIEDRIAATQQRLDQLKAQKEAHDARKLAALLKGQRSEDTRRKILIGAMVLGKMQDDPQTRQRILDDLDAFLTRNDDRALFSLPALPTPEGSDAAHQALEDTEA